MSQTIIITAAGRAALVNAANTGTNPVTITQLGVTETAFTPTAALTSLPSELKRLSALSGVAVADDAIHLTVRDDSADAYAMRGYGFYLSDGTLFAVHGQTAPILNKTAASLMLLSLDVAFADADAELIEFGDANFILPTATTTVYGQVKLSTLAAAQAGTDASSVLTPSTAKQSVLGWLLSQDGSGSGLDADQLDGKDASEFMLASMFTGAQILSRLVTADGSGSGLDADTLDGMDGASFLQASLFTGAQILSRLATVDGSGSGLDADTLDGQQATYFTDIAARLGYTPLNAANYTAADILTKLMTLDGSGSGLDADTVDGLQAADLLQSSQFTAAQIISKLGYTPLDTASYTAADVRTKLRTVDGSGSGSGIDADTVDGLQASQFLRITASSFGVNGYVSFSNGLIVQWGRATITANASTTITYPVAFTTNSSPVITSVHQSGNATAQDNGAAVTAVGLTNFTVFSAQDTASNGWWISIGY